MNKPRCTHGAIYGAANQCLLDEGHSGLHIPAFDADLDRPSDRTMSVLRERATAKQAENLNGAERA